MLKWRVLLAVSLILALQIQPIPMAQADPGPEFYASPSAVMPGGTVVIAGIGFFPSSNVDLFLLTPSSQHLTTLQTNSNGELSGSAVIPMLAPGNYQLMADPPVVTIPLTVLPAMTLDLQPPVGPPGTVVHFIASNLQAGQLRLDYDNLPVFGPVTVEAGVFEGDFLVPSDRPTVLGVDVDVKAFNLFGDQVMGSISAIFYSQEPNPSPYTFQNVTYPPSPITPGFNFTITGKILPAPTGFIAPDSLKVLWKSAKGQVVPITSGSAQILSDGSFSVNAHAPSLMAGDPLIPQAGDQVGLVFTKGGPVANELIDTYSGVNKGADPVFVVKVVDNHGAPIPNAIVDVRNFYDSLGSMGAKTSSGEELKNNLNHLTVTPNQISEFLGKLSPAESDPYSCQSTDLYGRTNAQGEFTVKFDPARLALLGSQVTVSTQSEHYFNTTMDLTFPLNVNALHQGFGVFVNNEPSTYTLSIRYSGATNHFYNAETNQLLNTNPFLVTLVPTGKAVKIPLIPKVAGGEVLGSFTNYLNTKIPMTAFGNFYSFPAALFPDAWINPSSNRNLTIQFDHDAALWGLLDESKVVFKLDGQTYPFIGLGPGEPGCELKTYRATVPNFFRFPAGNHLGLIEVPDQSVPQNVTRYYVQLNLLPAPTWILDPIYKYHFISGLINSTISIQGSQYPPNDPSSVSNLDTQVDKVGQLNNRVSNQDLMEQYLFPNMAGGLKYNGSFGATVLNEGTEKTYGDLVAGGKEISFGPQTDKVLDTGKIPLYRHVFGIPPIAGATIGADMWFDAILTYDGKVKLLSNGSTSTTLNVTPAATIGVDAFFDGEVLFGVVSAEAHAVPSITLKMPAQFVNGSLTDSTKCFLYKLDVNWEVSAGVWPFEISKSGTEHVFNGANPDPCVIPSGMPTQVIESSAAVTTSPPMAAPAIATDGFGNTLLVWVADGNIQSQRLSGGQVVVNNLPVTASHTSSDPQVVFYAPNKAVAAWTESSLTATQSQTASLAERVEAQYLKYALWDGTSWGAPANLTLPGDSNGEGKVVLAGCLSTKSGCPAGGAATAAWVRNFDPGADLSLRQFRLYFATFTGSTWTAAQAVDPSSSASDDEASVAYQPNGIPVVAWVRDIDQIIRTVDDRWIAHRVLQVGQPVVVETDLPTRVVEPSLAFNTQGNMLLAFTVATDPLALVGNQRQLTVAKGVCSGSCSWTTQALVDVYNRPIHAENPSLTLNASGQAQVTYRALGFGAGSPGDPVVLKGDALGTILGTGEIAQAFVDFSKNMIAPSYLSSSGKTVWQVTSVYDSLLNQVFTVGSLGSAPLLTTQQQQTLAELGYPTLLQPAVDGPISFSAASALPDLSISDASTSTVYPQAGGGPFQVQVSVLNNGPAFGRVTSVNVVLSWDAPAGLGTPAGDWTLTGLTAGSLNLIEFNVDPPDPPHLQHSLYIQVNPNQSLDESSFENNTVILPIGGIPAPAGLKAAAQPGDSSVFLKWNPVDLASVVGFRLYRSSDGRSWEPIGSAFTPFFVDLSAVLGRTYQYAVTAYDSDGAESPLSEKVTAVIALINYSTYLPVIRR